MPVFRSAFASGRVVTPNDASGDLMAFRVDFQVQNPMVDTTGTARANFAVNDVIEMFDLPVGHVIDDLVFVADDIDSNGTPTVSLAVGFINATDNGLDTAAANGGAALIAATNIGQAGGVARPTTAATWRIQPTLDASATPNTLIPRRRVGIHVVAAPATLQAGLLSLVARIRSVHSPANV